MQSKISLPKGYYVMFHNHKNRKASSCFHTNVIWINRSRQSSNLSQLNSGLVETLKMGMNVVPRGAVGSFSAEKIIRHIVAGFIGHPIWLVSTQKTHIHTHVKTYITGWALEDSEWRRCVELHSWKYMKINSLLNLKHLAYHFRKHIFAGIRIL